MQLPHGAFVVIADGEKYLILENRGDHEIMDLRVLGHDEIDVPPNRDLVTDKAGRMADSGQQRSAVGSTEWHELEQAEFARTLTDRLNRLALEDRFDAIVIAADPETLGQMRESYHDGLLERLVAEIDKNYTHAPIPEIERRLRDHAVKA